MQGKQATDESSIPAEWKRYKGHSTKGHLDGVEGGEDVTCTVTCTVIPCGKYYIHDAKCQ